MNQGRSAKDIEESVWVSGTVLWCIILAVCIAVLVEGLGRLIVWLK